MNSLGIMGLIMLAGSYHFGVALAKAPALVVTLGVIIIELAKK